MKFRLKGLCAVSVVLLGSKCSECSAMNLDTSRMRPTQQPLSYELKRQLEKERSETRSLWNRINEQNKKLSDKDVIIGRQNREISEKDQEISELKEIIKRERDREKTIADLEETIRRLMDEREQKPEADLSRQASYDIIGNSNDDLDNVNSGSNVTLCNEKPDGEDGDLKILGETFSPISKSPNLGGFSKFFANDFLSAPEAQRNSRENALKADAGNFQNASIPPAPPLPPIDHLNNIPPPPPLPPIDRLNGIPSPPPLPPVDRLNNIPSPPPLPPVDQSPQDNSLENPEREANSENLLPLIESIWANQRRDLYENLELERMAAKISNLWLMTNPAEIDRRISSYGTAVRNLAESLRAYCDVPIRFVSSNLVLGGFVSGGLVSGGSVLNDSAQPGEGLGIGSLLGAVSELSDRLAKRSNGSVAKFSDISHRIDRLALRYFNEISRPNSSPDLGEIGEFVIESVRIADSLKDLESLREKSANLVCSFRDNSSSDNVASNGTVSDRAVKYAFEIIRLGQKIAAEFNRGVSSSKMAGMAGTAEATGIEEIQCLELAQRCILEICKGKNPASEGKDQTFSVKKFSKQKDPIFKLIRVCNHINDNHSKIAIPENQGHPLAILSKLPKDMNTYVGQISEIFEQACSADADDDSSYSQFGTSTISEKPGASPLDLQIKNSENVNGESLRRLLDEFENFSGWAFGDGVKKLITVDRNLCPSFETLIRSLKTKLNIIPARKSKKLSSKNLKHVSADLKNSKFLCLLKNADGDILPLSNNAGTQLSRLRERGTEVIERVRAVSKSLQNIPQYLEESYDLFSGELKSQTVSECIDIDFKKIPALSEIIQGDFKFSEEDGHIVIEINGKVGKDSSNFSLTDDDMVRIIFSVALNSDLIVESGSNLFKVNENIYKKDVIAMTENLASALTQVRESLKFVLSREAFKTEELRAVFAVDPKSRKFETINQLDNLIEALTSARPESVV